MNRRTLIAGATATGSMHLMGSKASANTGIPTIPDARIAFGEVGDDGIWRAYAEPIPDEAIILGFQFVGHQFWPLSYRMSYASGYSIQQGMSLFSVGPMNVWYRLPDGEMWRNTWYHYHVEINESTPSYDGYGEPQDEGYD